MSNFITNIEEANSRVNALEQQKRLPKSEFIENLEAANARIAELEAKPVDPPKLAVSAKAMNSTLAFYETGKGGGLGKAILAASKKSQR